jgi:AcrR family transcriptional regulator
MQRQARAEQSRRQVLDAALQLFSTQGFRGTNVREIAEKAGVSTGNVYHHFEDKETIFRALLDEFWALTDSKRYPLTRVLTSGRFPEDLEQLGCAARDSVREYRAYIALVYVDVIEFDGTHIRKFYAELSNRYAQRLQQEGVFEGIRSRLRDEVSPVSAMMLATRIFINYFSMEILFGVPEPFGKDSQQIIKEIADILRFGMVDSLK